MSSKAKGFLAVCVVAAGLLVSGFLYFLTQRGENPRQLPETEGSGEIKEAGDGVLYEGQRYKENYNLKNILFMGIDKTGEVELKGTPGVAGQADSVNLMIFDKKEKTYRIMQISRDSMIDIDICDVNGKKFTTSFAQINMQYAYGDGGSGSCRLMTDKVSELLYGTPVTGYIALNISGIHAVNQVVGGVRLTVPEDYTDIDPAFQKGAELTLTDEQAEKYVRRRDIQVTGSNNGRMERQLQFMRQFAAQAKRMALSDPGLMDRALKVLDEYLVTNLTPEELKTYLSYEYTGEDDVIVPGEVVQGEIFDEYHVDEEALYKMILDVFYTPT